MRAQASSEKPFTDGNRRSGSCEICCCQTPREARFCYVHEPYARASRGRLALVRDALYLAAVAEERARKTAKAAARAADPRSDLEIATSEWRPNGDR